MKKIIVLFCLIFLFFSGPLLAADQAVLKTEATTLIKAYVTELKGALKTAMKAGGPVMAIKTCRLNAPVIARRIGHEKGWQVGRTSLKVRNPDNRPDAWEKGGLEAFETLHKKGVATSKLVQSAIVDDEEGQRFRFLKAIPTGKLCLSCHGEKISAKVRQALKESYPQDQALGFRPGDLRGAFSLSKPLY